MSNKHINKLNDLQNRFNKKFERMTDDEKQEFTNLIFKIAIQREKANLEAVGLGESLLNKTNNIQPQHYRKGEIDLFESWYRTYPLNEFRAIMEAIAERYMKRDKEDRVQDLSKAIYTLERLKEYEEEGK